MKVTMNESERWLAITALNSAAGKWGEWSTTIANQGVAEQFAKQAKKARELALKLASY